MRKRTLQDIYTREQIRKFNEIYSTGLQYNYCPIAFIFPRGSIHISCSSGDTTLVHIKAQYMHELLFSAMNSAENMYPSFLSHEWKKTDGYFKKLYYTNPCFEDAKAFLWKELERIADEGLIRVKESKMIDENNNLTLVCHNYKNIKEGNHFYDNNARNYSVHEKSYSYVWSDVYEYFSELSVDEIAFLHGEEMNDYSPHNQPLFDACSALDLEGIKKAILDGADINAFDKYGETPLCHVIDAVNFGETEIHEKTHANELLSKILEILDFLISEGADVNLYGFDSFDALALAHFSWSPEILEYLFMHGARKDLNSYITDLADTRQWYTMNSIYDSVATALAMNEYDEEEILLKEKAILQHNGVDYYIEGYTEEKISDYYNSYPDLTEIESDD